MVAKIAGVDATSNKESVTGVERTVGAAEKIGLEVGVMVKLGDHGVINAFLNLQILDQKIKVKIAGLVATRNKENVTGVERMVGVVNKVGLEMDVMEKLEEVVVINANLIQIMKD